MNLFVVVFGSPVPKREAIKFVLDEQNINPHKCLMVGDSKEDLEAAKINCVPFLLRQHNNNSDLIDNYISSSIENFANII